MKTFYVYYTLNEVKYWKAVQAVTNVQAVRLVKMSLSLRDRHAFKYVSNRLT